MSPMWCRSALIIVPATTGERRAGIERGGGGSGFSRDGRRPCPSREGLVAAKAAPTGDRRSP